MKLFSTLFLSLALITGAAQAHNNLSECELENDIDLSVNCDCDYCDSEITDLSTCNCNCDCEEQEAPQAVTIPSNPQEKLEWGLKNLTIRAVVQALHAGANPEELSAENKHLNAYGVLLNGISSSSDTQSPDEFEAANAVLDRLTVTRKAYEIAKVLIAKGVSVDAKKALIIFGHGSSCREMIQDFVTNEADIELITSPYLKEYRHYALILTKNLQTLINKYQPEVKA